MLQKISKDGISGIIGVEQHHLNISSGIPRPCGWQDWTTRKMLFTESHVYVLRGVLKNIYIHSTWNSHCTATRPVSVGPKCEGHDACRTLWTAQCGWSGRWRWPEAREAELGPGGPYAMVQIKFCMNGFLTFMVQMTLPPSSTLYFPIWRKPPSLLHLLFCTDTC